MLRHEFTHALVDSLSGGRTPTWLNEGLARILEHPEGSVQSGELRPQQVPASLLDLPTEFLALPPDAAEAAYNGSYEATKHLIRQFGFNRVRNFLRSLSRTSKFSTAFLRAFGARFEEFDASWTGGLHDGGLE